MDPWSSQRHVHAGAGRVQRVAANWSVIAQLSAEPSWQSWHHMQPSPGQAMHWQPMHFHELEHTAYLEWLPVRRSLPRVCVVSIYTPELLARNASGAAAATINANWALGHGYKYSIFTKALANISIATFGYSLLRSALFMLEQGEEECAFVFGLDGDAVVNRWVQPLKPISDVYMRGDLLLTCSSPYSHQLLNRAEAKLLGQKRFGQFSSHGCGPARNPCRCIRDTSTCSAESEAWERPADCRINIGAYLIRNTRVSREIMRWWAGAGNGACNWIGRRDCGLPGKAACKSSHPAEQDCAIKLKDRWRRSVDIVSSRVMNLPSWFSPRLTVHDFKLNVEKVHLSLSNYRGADLSFEMLSRCFRYPEFICHPYGIRNVTFRHLLFTQLLHERQERMRSWLNSVAAGQRFVEISLPEVAAKNG